VCAAALAGLACLSLPVAAQAGSPHSPQVKPPNGVHLVKVSSSSFTVASKAATGARGYRLFVSTTKGDLYAGRLGSARASRLYPTPMLSIAHLPYAATPYYYRLAAVNGSKRSFSATIGSVGLVPAVPTNLVVSTTALGTSLTWSSAPATGYRILASSSPTMASPQTFTITGLDKQFTPYGLTKGQTYYFQVAALNGTTASPLTAPVATPVPVMTSEQHVSVMSYNILELTTDRTKEGDGTVAPWSQRVVAVANLIQKASPDVVAIQEGAPWVGGVKGPRQVDSLVSQLGGDYSLASTEVPPSQANYFRTGDYILYKNSAYQPIGVGNHWNLPDAHFAAYQVLQNTTTGAKFLFVAPHMIVGNGATFDQQREDETNSMLTQVSQFMSSNPMPVVYAGDFTPTSPRSTRSTVQGSRCGPRTSTMPTMSRRRRPTRSTTARTTTTGRRRSSATTSTTSSRRRVSRSRRSACC
jgi:endonuclease/exonuclease/phosphatase family metal-dependent hydrolase